MTVPNVPGSAKSESGRTRTKSTLWNASGESTVAVVEVVTLAR
jgi:hypothetical protein